MKRRPRYRIRQLQQNSFIYKFLGQERRINPIGSYFCLDNQDCCFVFENYTWDQVLNWINSDKN